MKTLIMAALASAIATTSFAGNYKYPPHPLDNPSFSQEADWVRNQHKYKRMHERHYQRRMHNEYHQNNNYHQPQHQSSNSDAAFMLGIILGVMSANNN
jgi:hypothetical protein